MDRKERQQARADRFRELAGKAEIQSTQAYTQSHEIVKYIPMGQPILVGHHSEKAHRNLLERSWNTMGKSVELSEKADYYNQKAEAVENNNSIYLGDDDAVERLQKKLDELGKKQTLMKETNKIIGAKKLSETEKHDKLIGLGYLASSIPKLFTPNCFGQIGYPSYTITNNGANIRRVKKQLENAIQMKSTEDKEYTIGDVRVQENYQDNRLQLFFHGKPDESIRTQLKHYGFRWSNFNGCWQSYLNNHQIERAKTIINNGKTV